MSTNGCNDSLSSQRTQLARALLSDAVVGMPAAPSRMRLRMALVPAWRDASLAARDGATGVEDRAGRSWVHVRGARHRLPVMHGGCISFREGLIAGCAARVAGNAASLAAQEDGLVASARPVAEGSHQRTAFVGSHARHVDLHAASAGLHASHVDVHASRVRLPASSSSLSACMWGYMRCMQGDMPRLCTHMAREYSYMPRMSTCLRRMKDDMPRLYADTRAEHPADAVCGVTYDACEVTCHACSRTCRPCNSSCASATHACCTMQRNRTAIGRTRGKVRSDRHANPRDRFTHRMLRQRFAPVRRLATASRAAIVVAYVGPQTGHDRAQSCPSKHPDGYREVPF